jgi:hypothetical protein
LSGSKKLANRKKNRLDVFAETRIFNLKLKNKNIATQDLITEIIFRFKLDDTVSLNAKLEKKIQLARRRVLRRNNHIKKNIKTWSSTLSMPEKTVEGLVRQGVLTKKNIQSISVVLATYRQLIGSGTR